MAESLKQRIRNGEVIIGVSVPINADRKRAEAILSKDKYDYITVDSQHSAFNEERLVSICAIAEELGVPVQFRIKHTRQAYLIGNLLDLGPWGIEVPQVELESTVDEAINSFYYPQAGAHWPVGMRSNGGAARYGLKGREGQFEYAEWWNKTGVLEMQLESVQATTNARKLAKLGVDLLSWGPTDLAFSLEGNLKHPFKTMDDCIRYVVEQLQGTQVKVSLRSGTPDQRDKYTKMGVTVLLERPQV